MGASGFHPLPITPYEPQQSNPLQMLAQVNQLKTAQLQQQGLAQENQQRQIGLQDQQAMSAAMHEWDGKDINGLVPLMVKHGASANAVIGLKSKVLEQQEKYSKIAADDATTGSKNLETQKGKNDQILGGINSLKDVPDEQLAQAIPGVIQSLTQQGALAPQEAQQASQIAQSGDPVAIRKQLDLFAKLHSTASQQMEQALKQAQTSQANATALQRGTQGQLDQVKLNLIKNAKPEDYAGLVDQIVPQGTAQNARTKSMVNFYIQRGDLDSAQKALTQAATFAGDIEKAPIIAKAEAPTKIATAGQEEAVRQSIAGKVKPVYAYDPKSGRTILTNQTDAQEQGLQATRPVTEKEISDDRQLNNRLSDVAQKISRYEKSMQGDLSASDKNAIAGLIGTDKFKAGAFGMEMPVDSLNQIIKAASFNRLSPEARTRIIAYRNAEEAMVGYQRVLSGSGRSSDKAMELNIATLPHPLVTSDVANEGMSQFKENIKIASQGLPTLPGIKSPDEVVQAMNAKPSAPSGKSLSMQQIMQAAKDHNVSIDEARRQAIAKGYTIQ